MEDYRVTQTGDEIQEILNQSPIDTADIAGLKEADALLDGRLEVVEGKIPAGASAENPLTDKHYVDDSIASASATFRGTYNEVTDLELTNTATHAQISYALSLAIDTADNNDYCFVQIPTSDATPTEIDSIERYKFVTGTGWEYEYTLNNSGFTAEQWASINSGITSGFVAKLADLPTNAELENLLNGKANAADVYTKSETYNKTELDAQLGEKANSADVYAKTDTYTKQEVDALITTPEVQYVTVTATAGTTSVTDVLPATGAANTIYRVGSWDGTQYATGVYSEYAWNGTTYILLDVKNYGFATGSDFDNPTTAQRELVTTVGSVLDGISEGVFDLTAKTGDSYATLADALTAANTSIPTNKKKGGMSIKFVQSSDNKYLQFRYMLQYAGNTTAENNKFVNVDNWQGVDDEPTAGSDNLVKSGGVKGAVLDASSKLGINGAFSVDNTKTDYVVNVRGLEAGTYCVSLKCVGENVPPTTIKVYRTSSYSGGIIDATKYNISTNGTVLEIEKTTETNYLWFFISQKYTYSAKFYIVKKEYFYDEIKNSFDSIKQLNQSVLTINGNITEINGDITDINGDIVDLETSIDDVNSRISSFHPSVIVDVELPVYRTDKNCFIKYTGAIESFNNYNVIVYSVTDIKKVKITGRGGINTVRVYAFYSSDELSTSTLVGEVGPAQTTDYDYEVNVPSGAVYMACTKYVNQTVLSVTHEDLQPDKKTVKEIKVENGNKVTISVPSNNKKLYMVIGPTDSGVGNGLIDFRYWGYAPLQSGIESTPVQLYSNISDCFGPFQIMAINNIDGDDTSHIYFTGGSHQYNNDITGSTPTARLGNVEIIVDGLKQTEFSGSFSTFEMTWENYIQAFNTKKSDGTGREVLKEIITLKYIEGEFKCCTELIPLEDITLHLFYGYQMCGINPSGYYKLSDHWKYINGTNREIDELTSGNKETMAMIGDSTTFHQEMWIDNSIDMGKREMCINNTTNGAFKSGSKGYFTIANNNTTLYKDSHYYLYGKYIFKLKEIS